MFKSSSIDRWLTDIRKTYRDNRKELKAIKDKDERLHKLIELNVKRQLSLLKENPVIVEAAKAGNNIDVRGCVYDINTGLLKEVEA